MRLQDFSAFVLDMDGTLIDSGKYHARAFADAVLELCGYALAPHEHHEFFASHTDIFSLVLNKRHGLSLDPAVVLASKRRRMQEIFVAELFEGAGAFLEHWHGRIPLAMATNSPWSFVQPALRDAGIGHYFECIMTADEVVHRKPHPEIIERTVQRLGVDPLATLVFEDQLIGIEAARAAGTHVVAVDNGQPVDFPPEVVLRTWSGWLNNPEIPDGTPTAGL